MWQRQRHVNRLRSTLREFYPQALEAFGTDLSFMDAVAILPIAPTSELGRRLSRAKIASALKKGGRQKNIQSKAEKIQLALRSIQLEAPATVAGAYGTVTASLVRLIAGLNDQIADLEQELEASFEDHPDAKILRSLPGLGTVLGARVLAEFGDDRTRYVDARARRNYAGTSPITKASGRGQLSSLVSLAMNACSTPATYGHSHRSPRHQEPGPITTYIGVEEKRTIRLSELLLTDSSRSCTAVFGTVRPTMNRSRGE